MAAAGRNSNALTFSRLFLSLSLTSFFTTFSLSLHFIPSIFSFCLFIVDILPAHFQLLRSCVLQWLTSDRWLDVVSLFISFLIWFQSEQRVVKGNVVLVCSFFFLFHLKLSVITEFELEYHCWLWLLFTFDYDDGSMITKMMLAADGWGVWRVRESY